MSRRRPFQAPTRFQDLPGWRESFDAALRAKKKAPAGHYVRYVGVQALRTVGNMVPPSSVTFVTTNFLLCMAIGVESFRAHKHNRREDEKTLDGKVIDFGAARRAILLATPEGRRKYFDGHDHWDPAVWSLTGQTPWPVKKALSAVRNDGGAE